MNSPIIIPPHQWTHDGGKVLFLKCVNADGTSHGGFQWPMSGEVIAPDWNPKADCGNGLHGWPWGLAVGDGKEPDYNGLWIVFEADPADIVDLGGKAKCRASTVILSGTYLECNLRILDGQMAWAAQAANGTASNSGYSGAASNSAANGAASNSGARGTASNSGARGAASNSGARGTASNSAARGTASNSGYSGAASNSAANGAASNSAANGAASNSGASGAASNSGANGTASNSGYSGAASNSAARGTASNSGYSGAASNSAANGAASNSGARGAASNSGARGIAASTGELSTVESVSSGVCVTTANVVFWRIRSGAVLCQRTEKGAWLLFADDWEVQDGQTVLVEHGEIWTQW